MMAELSTEDGVERLANDFLYRAAAAIQRHDSLLKQTVGEIGDKSPLLAALVNVQGLIYHADVCGPRIERTADSLDDVADALDSLDTGAIDPARAGQHGEGWSQRTGAPEGECSDLALYVADAIEAVRNTLLPAFMDARLDDMAIAKEWPGLVGALIVAQSVESLATRHCSTLAALIDKQGGQE